MTVVSDHQAYIAAAPAALRPLLELVHAKLSETLPDADEIIKYDMPGFASEGVIIAGYASPIALADATTSSANSAIAGVPAERDMPPPATAM